MTASRKHRPLVTSLTSQPEYVEAFMSRLQYLKKRERTREREGARYQIEGELSHLASGDNLYVKGQLDSPFDPSEDRNILTAKTVEVNCFKLVEIMLLLLESHKQPPS